MASSNAQWLRPHCSPGGRAQLPSTQRERRLESLAAWPQITSQQVAEPVPEPRPLPQAPPS